MKIGNNNTNNNKALPASNIDNMLLFSVLTEQRSCQLKLMLLSNLLQTCVCVPYNKNSYSFFLMFMMLSCSLRMEEIEKKVTVILNKYFEISLKFSR